jgi:hypothetical protein
MSVEQGPAKLADTDAANATALDVKIPAIFIKIPSLVFLLLGNDLRHPGRFLDVDQNH